MSLISVQHRKYLYKFSLIGLFVSALSASHWFTSDARMLGWIGDLTGTFNWFSNMFSSTTGTIASADNLHESTQIRRKSSHSSSYNDKSGDIIPPLCISDAILKLDAVTYTLALNRTLTPNEAELQTINVIRRSTALPTGIQQDDHRNSRESEIDDAVSQKSSRNTPVSLPSWLFTDGK